MIDPQKLCQIEITSSDLERSLAFYEGVFGWKKAPADLHNYIVLSVPSDCPYGISLVPGIPSTKGRGIVLYYGLENPEEIIDRVEDNGGKILMGPQRLPGYGMIYQFKDPDGNVFGIFSQKKKN